MAYAMKPLSCNPDRINGISERLIISHYENNYGGAVQARRWSLYCLQLWPAPDATGSSQSKRRRQAQRPTKNQSNR
jgi:hypothetical protein